MTATARVIARSLWRTGHRRPSGNYSGESRLLLEAAIDRLPEHHRGVLVLRDVEELSNKEVAQIVGDTVSAVKTRLHGARMALREQLTRHLGSRT